MFVQPVLVYQADEAALRRAYERALSRGVELAVYTRELFETGHDEANRAQVAAVPSDALDLVGIAFRADRKVVDKVVDRLRLHPCAPSASSARAPWGARSARPLRGATAASSCLSPAGARGRVVSPRQPASLSCRASKTSSARPTSCSRSRRPKRPSRSEPTSATRRALPEPGRSWRT